jgi:hypothetical protein
MIIKLEDLNPRQKVPMFVATRPRLATATSVRLLDTERLVVCSLVGQRMYLMRYDLGSSSFEIEDSVPTRVDDDNVFTDLLAFDGTDLLATSNCYSTSASLYRITGNRLSYVKTVPVRDGACGFCHGVCFVPTAPDTLCLTMTQGNCNVYFVSMTTSEVLYQFGDNDWKPHDACFVDDHRMIVVYLKGSPRKRMRAPYEAKAALISIDVPGKSHQVLNELELGEAHVDCCRVAHGRLYLNNQTRDAVTVCRLEGAEIAFEREIPGFDFPHGLDVLSASQLLAVTNYGNNTVVLSRL